MVSYEGQPMALRVRPDADTAENRALYPRLAVVTHRLAEVRSDGLPESNYNDGLPTFELAVIEALEADGAGLVVLVETFVGERSYYAYVVAASHAESAFRSLSERFSEHDLAISGRSDREWGLLDEYRRRFPW
jgi:hypothetical protein